MDNILTEAEAFEILLRFESGRASLSEEMRRVARLGKILRRPDGQNGNVFGLLKGSLFPELVDPRTAVKYDYAALQEKMHAPRPIEPAPERIAVPRYTLEKERNAEKLQQRVSELEGKLIKLHDELSSLRRHVLGPIVY